MYLLTAIIFVSIIICLCLYIKKRNSYWKDLGVPYAEPTLLFGNLLSLLQIKSSAFWFRNLYESTNHLFYGFFFTLNTPALLIRDPELIKQMFVKNSDFFAHRLGGQNCNHDKMGVNSMFFMKSPTWKIVRKALVPFFSPYKLANLSTIVFKTGDNLVAYIESEMTTKPSIDVPMMASMYTSDIIGTGLFGLSAESLTHKNTRYYVLSEMLAKESLATLIERFCFGVFPRVAQFLKMRFFDKTSTQILKRILVNTMEQRKSSTYVRGDFLDLLNSVERRHGEILKHDELVAQAFQMHFAAHTSTNTIILALHEICLHPHVQARLRQEITQVLSKHEVLSLRVLYDMVYLDMVVSETLRKHPIAPILERVCTKSYTIPDTNIVIKKGLPCFVSVYGLHHNSEFFPNPEKFDPERFSPENRPNIVSGSYLPFGIGPRNCIATRLGLLTVKVALMKIIHNFEIELGATEDREIGYDPLCLFIGPNKNSSIMKFKPVRRG
uniref:Cytochrome P450 n=1 Tax=Photinus pyralis TaxID=7054 RepID=A0A1Y1N6S6_PHOPY